MKIEHSQNFINAQISLFKLIQNDDDFLIINHKFKTDPSEKYLKTIITEQILGYIEKTNIIKSTLDLIKFNTIGLNNKKIIKNIHKMKSIDKAFILLFYYYYLDMKNTYKDKSSMPKLNFKSIIKEEIVSYIDLSKITIDKEDNDKKSLIANIINFTDFGDESNIVIDLLYKQDKELLKYKQSTLKLAKQLYLGSNIYDKYIKRIIESTSDLDIDRNMKDLRLNF